MSQIFVTTAAGLLCGCVEAFNILPVSTFPDGDNDEHNRNCCKDDVHVENVDE